MNCPNCNYAFDTHTHVGRKQEKPSWGDVTVCFGCAQVLVLDENGIPVIPSPEFKEEIMKDPKLKRLVEATVAAIVKFHLENPLK